MDWNIVLIIVVAFLIAALPLYFTVKILGGKTGLLKTVLVNILVGVAVALIYTYLPFATLIAFIATIWLYREFFRLKWWKALVAWFMQGFVAFLLVLLVGALFGISLLF
jgi:hypothetical protein